jgi:hypothetical protein
MSALVGCPSPESWPAYLQGAIPQRHSANLALHLETCAACQATVDRLTQGTGVFLEAVSRWRHASEERSAACERALAGCIGRVDLSCPDGGITFQVMDRFTGRQRPRADSAPAHADCTMSSSSPSPSVDAKHSKPVLGILVDCNSSKARMPNAGLRTRLKAPGVIRIPTEPLAKLLWAQFRERLSSRGVIRVAAVGAGLLIVISTMVVGLNACLTSTVDQDGSVAQAEDQSDTTLKAEMPAKIPAKKEAAQPNAAPATTEKNPAPVIEATVPVPEISGPPEKSDWQKLEAASFKGSSHKPVKELALKDEGISCSTPDEPKGEFFGTAVAFVDSPRIAGEQALKQHKLVFVLHVSGNFEDPGFT